MEVMRDGKIAAVIPDTMSIGDTIIMSDGIYEIISKTIDLTDDKKPIYCKIQPYGEPVTDSSSICQAMSEIYLSPTLDTGGYNTNTIEDNPRLIVFMIVLSAMLEGDYFKSMAKTYRDIIIVKWKDKSIPWEDIFTDDVKVSKKLSEAISVIKTMLKSAKINEDIWPNGLRTR